MDESIGAGTGAADVLTSSKGFFATGADDADTTIAMVDVTDTVGDGTTVADDGSVVGDQTNVTDEEAIVSDGADDGAADGSGKAVVTIPATVREHAQGGASSTLRVAAYCRVSTDEERQLDSLGNQVEYFGRLIAQNRSYELVRIYFDEGLSGTRTRSRKGFQEMVEACEQGQVDLVVTKSISRFARNTQDSLSYTRRLKELGVGVYFEKEGINTLESSGELLLTLFSCFAQEESRSISENTAWGIRSRFQQGIPHLNAKNFLGYDRGADGKLVINEEQAAIVRRIYRMFLEGYALGGIARSLNEEGVVGVRGAPRWCGTTISRILQNEKYKGALLMQKTFTASYLTRQQVRNTGQLPRYYIEEDHPPIVSPELWEAAQEEIARRREFRARHGLRGTDGAGKSPFYARFFCRNCDTKFQRIWRKGVSHPYWSCLTCGKKVDDEELRAAFCRAFNRVVDEREQRREIWRQAAACGTALERLRARQMEEICREGTIPYEVPELTQAVLEEAWLEEDGRVTFRFLSGDEVAVQMGQTAWPCR